MLKEVASYFDINRDVRALALAESKTLHWIPQFLFLAAGVFIQPVFTAFRESSVWAWPSWGWAAFSVITAFLIFPAVYRRAFDAKKPWIVLVSPIFAAGLGWESLLGTVVEVGSRLI